MSMPTYIIAVDGPAGAGKGLFSRNLSQKLNCAVLDTGLLYRAVGVMAQTHEISLDNEKALAQIALSLTLKDLENPLLRSDEAGQLASKVAVFPDVRAALLTFQRNFAQTPPPSYDGVILDGRDIGTIILPDAPYKFYITASAETRALRRQKEFLDQGLPADYDAIFKSIQERDHRDQSRSTAPLVAAAGAHVIDTSNLTPDEALAKALAYIQK